MSTRRARKHKGLVDFEKYEKKKRHQSGACVSQHRKTRWKSLVHAVMAESAYEWHISDKQYLELAQELYEAGPIRVIEGMREK